MVGFICEILGAAPAPPPKCIIIFSGNSEKSLGLLFVFEEMVQELEEICNSDISPNQPRYSKVTIYLSKIE